MRYLLFDFVVEYLKVLFSKTGDKPALRIGDRHRDVDKLCVQDDLLIGGTRVLYPLYLSILTGARAAADYKPVSKQYTEKNAEKILLYSAAHYSNIQNPVVSPIERDDAALAAKDMPPPSAPDESVRRTCERNL